MLTCEVDQDAEVTLDVRDFAPTHFFFYPCLIPFFFPQKRKRYDALVICNAMVAA